MSMGFLWMFLIAASLWANQAPKPRILPLKEGPVKAALKKNYKIHLVRNFQLEAERELDKKLSKK